MPEESEGKAAEQSPKKGKGMLIVVAVLVVALLGGGAFVALKLLKKPAAAAESADGEGAGAHSAPVVTAEMGEILFTDTFLVNLADPGGSRYLKITLSIEGHEQVDPKKKKAAPSGGHGGAGGAESPDNPKIKDTVITILSSKTFQEISNPQGKIALKQELQRRLNSFLNPHIQVTNIYITEFVVQ